MTNKNLLIFILIFIILLIRLFFIINNKSDFFNKNINNVPYKNIILSPTYYSIGDSLSIIGLSYFLLNYYERVYFTTHTEEEPVSNYYKNFFSKYKGNKQRIFVISYNDPSFINQIKNSDFNDFHVCNLNELDKNLFNFDKIDKTYYFNPSNPLYNILPIQDKYLYRPSYNNLENKSEYQHINHIFHYHLIGLSNLVRMDFFDYTRDHEKEQIYKKQILEKNNLSETDKYNIIYSAGQSIDYENLKKYNKNDYITIDIHNLVDFPGWLFSLIEGAECVNLIEGSTCNFIYHCQYKNIITLNMPIYFHVWLRIRDWVRDWGPLSQPAWKMMTEPILPSWQFIYEDL